ncbi:glycosyltransferase family 4 protein [Pseudoalteromonas denitrificans]|uniref:Glycosyltransferase involved in cell wall bisynthesis n=1 Tax=Pseudoalteromonas denitrificans DSM 6059 TaxID=1123010 RepID=A0A1I1EPE5_9GAMM|nr:glycosyltransferase [Pseudoalteromonas denitrificans]SFB88974.1 Glycosyltransferase involved in cell wall bisynthesis [Pseudoalteromonas denitrificans DSM 6059]
MNKIAYVLSSYPVLSETFVSTEMRAMEACGHEVQPIAFNHYEGEFQEQDTDLKDRTLFLSDYSKSIALKALPAIGIGIGKAIKFALLQKGISFYSLVGNALKLAYLAKRTHCTHFHAHFCQGAAATAIVAARLCGATVSFVGHGYDVYATPQDLPLKLASVDFAIAVCKDMVSDFKELSPKVNVSLVYCGIEPNRFKPTHIHNNRHEFVLNLIEFKEFKAFQKKFGKKDKKGKLLFIGRLCETKGLFTLLAALRLIPKEHRPQLDLVGDGVLREQLIEYVKKNKLSQFVNFLGAKQSSWFIESSKNYDAMVAPFELASNGDRDTGPVVVKEAMALKLPVITTYFMGCNEFLTRSTGLRVPPKDPIKLASMIKQFYRMPVFDVLCMKNNAYKRVCDLYTAQKQARKLSSLIENTANHF